MKNVVSLAVLLTITITSQVAAIVVDFHNFPVASYVAGDSFTSSNGVHFRVIPYNGAGTTVSVFDGRGGRYFMLLNSIGIEVALPANINLIELDYFDACILCNTSGITVNGESSSPLIELEVLNGTELGGATVDVAELSGARLSRIKLNGTIDSFAVGGTSLILSHLRISVPEPSTFSCWELGSRCTFCDDVDECLAVLIRALRQIRVHPQPIPF